MDRLNRALIALSVCAGFAVASPVYAQQASQEPLKPILTGKFVPPVTGTADVQYTRAKVTRKGKQVITVLQVKNVSSAPIAGFKCSETWYDKQRALLPGAGDTYVHKGLFQPGDVITITLTDDVDPRMDTNQYQFTHARGTVKGKVVPKF
jgi:hypothetical protein